MSSRVCLNAIFLILKTGAQWASIPRSIGPHTTIHGKFRKWVKEGVFGKIMNKARSFYQKKHPEQNLWFSIDGSNVKAPLGGEKTGKNPTDRGKLGSKKSIIVDQKGAPLAIAIGAANTHDSKLFAQTLKAFEGAYNNDLLKIFAGDTAYDAAYIKRQLNACNFVPLISINKRRSGEKPEKRSSRHRWIVERSHAWLNNFRSLKTRWARGDDSFLGLCQFTCSIQLFSMAGIFV